MTYRLSRTLLTQHQMGHEDLGTHFEAMGKLREAAESYGKMRQDVTSTKHIVDCSQRLIGVALQRRDWTGVINQANKITSVNADKEQTDLHAYLLVALGIGQLGHKKYESALNYFLQLDSKTPPETYNEVISPNDIALYGTLLSLASLDKKDIQHRVLDNAGFRPFLEHEPHARKAINLYINGRYPDCLAMLESIKPDALLDIYFSQHLETIYSRIRQKCIKAYFFPFSCVSLDTLHAAFGGPDHSLEHELVDMIRNGSLKARIDAKEKVHD